MEGIFRLAGSEKRIKELKVAFDSPDRYGKGLDWTGYTVHDAANILRRYFNQLPEPIIPLEFYERFRDPLKNHQAQAVGAMDSQSPTVGEFDPDAAIRIYQALITELPPLNRQLLLYILDLLAVFASKSDLNKMTTPNLAAIFQPGLLSHPQHDMAPQEYRLSQDVLIFLIENQDSFLIGMPGTAADHDTVKEVQSGVPSPGKTPSSPSTPSRSKTVIGRSSSNASTDAGGRWNNLRRNVSVSSKHSKRSEAGPTPVTPNAVTPAGSVHRSNTVPSRRAGSAAPSPRFAREKTSDPPTPSRSVPTAIATDAPKQESLQSTPVATVGPGLPIAPPEIISASSSEATTPLATIGSDTASTVTRDYQTPKKDTTPLLAPLGSSADRSGSATAATSHGLLNIFKQSPTSDSEGRKPNKLQKKRIPGSTLSSAHSSTHSLEHGGPERLHYSPMTPSFPPGSQHDSPVGGLQSNYATAQSTPVHMTPQRMPTDATLKPTISPTHSFNSHASATDQTDHTDQSDADMVGDDMPANSTSSPEKQKRRHRWRFSRSQNKLDQAQSPPPSGNPLGTMSPKDQAMSRSTIGSSSASASQPRRSFQEPVPLGPSATDPATGQPMTSTPGPTPSATDPSVFSDSERERRGPMSWIRGKLQDRKDKDAEKRTRTPERSRARGESSHGSRTVEALPVRGPSIEQQRAAGNVGSLPARGQSLEQQRAVSNASAAPIEPKQERIAPQQTPPPAGPTPIVKRAATGESTNTPGLPSQPSADSGTPTPTQSQTQAATQSPQGPNGAGNRSRVNSAVQERADAIMEGK